MATEEKKVEAVQGGMDVVLHPLVVISISDQFTRVRLNNFANGVKNVSVAGVLLGIPNKGKVEITNSFDIKATFDPKTGKLVEVDETFLKGRTEAFITVFPETTVVGWYISGSCIDPADGLIMTKALSAVTESETMYTMAFDGIAAYDEITKDLPIRFFEATLKEDKASVSYKQVPYHVITIEPERIGVDHIAKSSTTEGSSQLTVHVLGMMGAMKMLHSKVDAISEYLEKVKNGTAPFDHEIMRKIGQLHDLILAAQAPGCEKRFFIEFNDEMLLEYLSSITEGLQAMNNMVDTHVVSQKPRAPRRAKAEKVKKFF